MRAAIALAVAGLALPACLDEAPAPPDLTGAEVHHYRITSIDLPGTQLEVQQLGFDLDNGTTGGDPGIENKLGSVYMAAGSWDAYYQTEAPARLRLGTDVPWMLTIYDAPGGGGVAVSRGVIVDGVAMPGLDGIEPMIGTDLEPGTILAGAPAMVPLGTLSDGLGTDEPGWVTATLGHAAVGSFDENRAQLRIGVAIDKADIDAIVAVRIAAFYTDLIARGLSELASETWDTDDDGVITPEELLADPLVSSLLSADLGVYDDTPEQTELSLGLRLTAVTAL